MTKTLHILTGPPGAGKTTYAKTHLHGIEVYDTDLGNKNEWIGANHDSVLMTSAPTSKQKSYWIEKAELYHFTPVLHCIFPPRMVSYQRMRARSGLTRWERNDLQQSVEQWYKMYTRHPREIRHE